MPVYSEKERLEIVKSLKFVDEVFLEDSLELKREYSKTVLKVIDENRKFYK